MTEIRSAPSRPARWRLRLVQALTVVVVTSASVGAFYLRDHLRSLAGYGYVAVFVVGLISNATVILPIPGLAVSSLMGGVFNPWLVGLAGGMGQALGELSGYMVGYSGQRLVDGDSPYRLLSSWMRRHGAVTIFLLALVPNPLFDLGGIAAGAFRFPIWKFLVSCAVGKVIKNTAFALAGYYGADALLRFLEAP